ncbi:MAG: NADH-quinone oxidoreductase subunit C [Alicyclobacillus sp.]|nr:NADH-quinone oxidoreductase subunit C [Alicyclobacillus sp.]
MSEEPRQDTDRPASGEAVAGGVDQPAAGPTPQVGNPSAQEATKPARASATARAAGAAGATRTAGAAGAAAKKAPPPPDPRVEAAKTTADQVRAALVAELGDGVVEETGAAHFTPMVRVRPVDWARAVATLKTHPDWQLNYLEAMAGTDYLAQGHIEVVVYLQSIQLGHFICLKTRVDRQQPELPSLVPVHPGANWEEREIFDLLGVHFRGHPDLRRIMLWDEFKGHPLRKDYNAWDEEALPAEPAESTPAPARAAAKPAAEPAQPTAASAEPVRRVGDDAAHGL